MSFILEAIWLAALTCKQTIYLRTNKFAYFTWISHTKMDWDFFFSIRTSKTAAFTRS